MQLRPAALLLAVALALVGCTGAAPTRDELRVSAAASLTEAFTVLGERFTAATGTEVALNLAGSATLVEQVLRGAPVDVLATADRATMQRAVEGEAVTAPVPLASNELVVAWPADGPERDVAAVADPDLLVGLCAPQVPCGAAARRALDDLGITPRPDTEDSDVRTLLTRLAVGELDVGIVYATDLAVRGGEVEGRALPGGATTLVVATVRDAGAAADDFVAYVTSPEAAAVLAEQGFGAATTVDAGTSSP